MFNLPPESTTIRTLAQLVAGQVAPAFIPEEQWTELVPLALDHGLGGMLLWSLRQAGWASLGAGADESESRWQPLVTASRRNGWRSLLLEKSRNQVSTAFYQMGIPAIWLKGVALAHTLYPEPHLRPMDDLDVLVPPDRMAEAREALLNKDFRPAEVDFFELGGFTDQARHHESFVNHSGQVKLELHFRLLAPALHDWLDELPMDWFWAETEEINPDGQPFKILKPEANLLYLCAHAMLQNHSDRPDLLHLLDLHLLLTQKLLEWDQVVEQASALGWTYLVEGVLGILPDLFSTQVPEGVLHELQARRPAGEQPVANMGPRRNTRRWEEWRSAFRRMTATQRLRLIWRTVFPPGAFLRQQYQMAPNQPLLRYYVYHLMDGGREVKRALRPGQSSPEELTLRRRDLS